MDPLLITQIVTVVLLIISEILGLTADGPNGIIHFIVRMFGRKIDVKIEDDDRVPSVVARRPFSVENLPSNAGD